MSRAGSSRAFRRLFLRRGSSRIRRIILSQSTRRVGDELIPVAAGVEDQLAHLAHRAPAAGSRQHPVHPLPHLGRGVGRREGEAAAADHRQVEQVVPGVGHPLRRRAVLGEERGEGGVLVMVVLDQGVEADLAGPRLQGGVAAAGEDADLEPRLLGQLQAHAVADVEDLPLLPFGAVDQASRRSARRRRRTAASRAPAPGGPDPRRRSSSI